MNANFGGYNPAQYMHRSNTLSEAGRTLGAGIGNAISNIPQMMRFAEDWQNERNTRNAGEEKKAYLFENAKALGLNIRGPKKGESFEDYAKETAAVLDAATKDNPQLYQILMTKAQGLTPYVSPDVLGDARVTNALQGGQNNVQGSPPPRFDTSGAPGAGSGFTTPAAANSGGYLDPAEKRLGLPPMLGQTPMSLVTGGQADPRMQMPTVTPSPTRFSAPMQTGTPMAVESDEGIPMMAQGQPADRWRSNLHPGIEGGLNSRLGNIDQANLGYAKKQELKRKAMEDAAIEQRLRYSEQPQEQPEKIDSKLVDSIITSWLNGGANIYDENGNPVTRGNPVAVRQRLISGEYAAEHNPKPIKDTGGRRSGGGDNAKKAVNPFAVEIRDLTTKEHELYQNSRTPEDDSALKSVRERLQHFKAAEKLFNDASDAGVPIESEQAKANAGQLLGIINVIKQIMRDNTTASITKNKKETAVISNFGNGPDFYKLAQRSYQFNALPEDSKQMIMQMMANSNNPLDVLNQLEQGAGLNKTRTARDLFGPGDFRTVKEKTW